MRGWSPSRPHAKYDRQLVTGATVGWSAMAREREIELIDEELDLGSGLRVRFARPREPGRLLDDAVARWRDGRALLGRALAVCARPRGVRRGARPVRGAGDRARLRARAAVGRCRAPRRGGARGRSRCRRRSASRARTAAAAAGAVRGVVADLGDPPGELMRRRPVRPRAGGGRAVRGRARRCARGADPVAHGSGRAGARRVPLAGTGRRARTIARGCGPAASRSASCARPGSRARGRWACSRPCARRLRNRSECHERSARLAASSGGGPACRAQRGSCGCSSIERTHRQTTLVRPLRFGRRGGVTDPWELPRRSSNQSIGGTDAGIHHEDQDLVALPLVQAQGLSSSASVSRRARAVPSVTAGCRHPSLRDPAHRRVSSRFRTILPGVPTCYIARDALSRR